jgi:hypothetical protein
MLAVAIVEGFAENLAVDDNCRVCAGTTRRRGGAPPQELHRR